MVIRNGLFAILLLVSAQAISQTCTISGSGIKNWDNNTAPGTAVTCLEGGTETAATVIVVPEGVRLVFNNSSDTWTGTRIDVYGILSITAPGNVNINGNVIIKADGKLSIDSKLQLGASGRGCNYNVITENDGTLDIVGTSGGSDRLEICGTTIVQGGGGCNNCSGTFSGSCAYNGQPYCENGGGFTGPVAFDKGGFNGILPIELMFFRSNHKEESNVLLEWATASEKNFDKFIIERSSNGTDFQEIGQQVGLGKEKQVQTYSFVDKSPLLGSNYYRLKSLDLDYTFEYSKVVHAEYQGHKNITLYPNPADGTSIKVFANFSPSGDDIVQVYDNLGVKLLEYRISTNENIIDFSNRLKQGTYFLRYIGEGHQQITRFSVK